MVQSATEIPVSLCKERSHFPERAVLWIETEERGTVAQNCREAKAITESVKDEVFNVGGNFWVIGKGGGLGCYLYSGAYVVIRYRK
jgi:hypothetical protein